MSDNRSLHIALFLGTDVSSHLLTNKLCHALIRQGHKISLFFPKHKPSAKAALAPLRELAFFEREILNNYIYPHLYSEPLDPHAPHHCPQHLAQMVGAVLEYPDDINAPSFIQSLHARKINLGISIRCYQKFGQEIIEYFTDESGDSYLWNLHPGVLPQYRGVMTCIRAMANGDSIHSYTLHAIDLNWDAGSVISMNPVQLDRSLPMLTNMFNLYPSGIELVCDAVQRVAKGERILSSPQNPEKARYYSFPNEHDFVQYQQQELRLVAPDQTLKRYLDAFACANTPMYARFERFLHEKIVEHQEGALH